MSIFARIFGVLSALALLGLPFVASERGYGIGTERNVRIIDESDLTCAGGAPRNPDGTCRRAHRSYFHNRSRAGGGYGFGK